MYISDDILDATPFILCIMQSEDQLTRIHLTCLSHHLPVPTDDPRCLIRGAADQQRVWAVQDGLLVTSTPHVCHDERGRHLAEVRTCRGLPRAEAEHPAENSRIHVVPALVTDGSVVDHHMTLGLSSGHERH